LSDRFTLTLQPNRSEVLHPFDYQEPDDIPAATSFDEFPLCAPVGELKARYHL